MKNETIRTAEDAEFIGIAFRALNRRYRILAPASEARVTYPEFNPFRAVQPVAIVSWPATVACREVVLTHTIHEGDAR